MKQYHLNHILPDKALLLFFVCFLPLASLTLFMGEVLQMEKMLAGLPIILGAGLGFYFLLFYTEGTRLVELTPEAIRAEEKSVKISEIKYFKLKNDSPEFIYLKIVTTSNEKLAIGTRTSSKEELLKLYSELKKAVKKHNKENVHQIFEKKLIHYTPLGKLLGVAVMASLVLMIYHRFFTENGTKSLGGFISALGFGSFLLFRIFGKRENKSH